MAEEILMPKLGLTMTEGTIGQWKKKEGDSVHKGDILFSVETDKLTNDVEADAEGVLFQILVQEGETVPCKTVVAVVGQKGEALSSKVHETQRTQKNAVVCGGDMSGSQVSHVVVIGGGPGGYVAAIRAAQLGGRVTLIETEKIGGTCLNVGCIPTKCLLHSAELLTQIKESAPQAGIKADNVELDFQQVMRHKSEVTQQLTSGVSGLLKGNGVEVIQGHASFAAPKTLRVERNGRSEELTADKIIIAVGSVNAVPPIENIRELSECIDSTGALSLETIPSSMVVIGGGVIGLEMACAYAQFGTKVTVVEMLSKALPMMDGELTEAAVGHLKNMGVEFHFDTAVQSVEEGPKGAVVKAKAKSGEPVSFEAERVLVAVGRRANTEQLGLELAGILNDRGRIIVDEHMETNVPGVYAVGDCVLGKAQLAHTASAMGEVAAENAMGLKSVYDQSTSPACVYLDPEFAGVGLTEEQVKEKGIAYKVGKFPMMANGKALILNGGQGMVKIIADQKYEEVLGVHILGPRATELIAEGALAIRLEATLEELISTIHSHPTVSESVREAALAAEKRAIHIKN